MDAITLHPVGGEPVATDALQVPKARAVAALLAGGTFPFIRLVECRRDETVEVIVVDVEPEVPPSPVHDIRAVERVAVSFDPDDLRQPDPRALRRTFPYPPHINLHYAGESRSLCLFEEPYAEQKPRWTAARFLGRLHVWLSKTARGELHAPDQGLEPLFFSTGNVLVVPAAFFHTDGVGIPERLVVHSGSTGVREQALVATPPGVGSPDGEHLALAGMTYTAQPRVHGVIRHRPRTLGDLHRYLAEDGEDLAAFVREQLRTWHRESAVPLGHRLLLMVRIPKARETGGPVETVEVWAFVSRDDIQTVGSDVGIWTLHDGHLAPNLDVDLDQVGDDTELHLYNVVGGLTRAHAAALNGEARPDDTAMLAIGAGALGSQLVATLLRSGFGCWTVVDEDLFYPHNAARHLLPVGVGYPKAELLASFLGPLIEDGNVTPIVADVLAPATDVLTQAYEATDVILDASASVAVARYLALDAPSSARRVSVFLTPDGRDLIVLAESADRATTIDHAEMEYYWALVTDDRLAQHLDRPGAAVRYGNGCRDTSGLIPQELVGLHAAIAARAVRNALASPEASVHVWRAHDDRSVTTVSVDVSPYSEVAAEGWTVVMSERLRQAVVEQRATRLPNETGGALVGAFDAQRQRIYLVDHVPAPTDSVEHPTAFVRGAEGLPEAFSHVAGATAGQLDYAGEWHSHPDHHSTLPSEDDAALFAWLSQHRVVDGFPPLMLIAGQGQGASIYIGTLPPADA